MLDGQNEVGAGTEVGTPPAPTSSALALAPYAPVLELVDRPALHAGDPPGRPGPIPGRGTFTQARGVQCTRWRSR